MPNGNAPMGLNPLRDSFSNPTNLGVETYYVPASDGTALYIGDPVVISGTGDAGGTPSVTLATAGGRITGVVQGFLPDPLIQANGYRAASTAAYVLVNRDPNAYFEVQEDSIGGALAVTAIGLNADLIAGAGSPGYKRSGWMLDSSTAATTNTLQVRIEGLVQRPDNEVGQYAKWLVRLNNSTETGAAGSTGI